MKKKAMVNKMNSEKLTKHTSLVVLNPTFIQVI
jgi:hypothetical protein